MRKFLQLALILALATAACGRAQSGVTYVWPAVSATGALPALDLRAFGNNGTHQFADRYTLSVSLGAGTNSVCTWQLEASDDAVTWYSVSGVQSCTAALMFSVADRPARMLRPNVLTYTGSATLTFYYTGA